MHVNSNLIRYGRAALTSGGLLLAVVLAGCSGMSASKPAASESSPSAEAPAESASPASAAASAAPSASAAAQNSGSLGMIFEVNNSGWQKMLGAPNQKGMVIVMVLPNQAGAKAGLTQGDVVMKMNGVETYNANVTNREIRKLKVGDKVTLDLARKSGSAKVDVTVEPTQQVNLADIFDGMLKTNPSDPIAYFLRGAYADSDVKAAIGDFGKAIDFNGNFVSAYVERGTRLQASDPKAAMNDFDKAASLDPNYEPLYVNRSVLYSAQKTYDKAMQDDQKAVQLDSTDPAAYANLGIGYVNMGKPADALNAENQALQQDPQFGPALLYRGLLQRDAARSDLQNAAKLVRDPGLRSVAESALQKMS